jgi:hypothetical protein
MTMPDETISNEDKLAYLRHKLGYSQEQLDSLQLSEDRVTDIFNRVQRNQEMADKIDIGMRWGVSGGILASPIMSTPVYAGLAAIFLSAMAVYALKKSNLGIGLEMGAALRKVKHQPE